MLQKITRSENKPIDLAGEVDLVELHLPTPSPDGQYGDTGSLGPEHMETAVRPLIAAPEGMLHLFLDGGVSIQHLAFAFETEAYVIESAVREAIRKREAITRAALPSGVELVRQLRSTG
jgi:hypothetical protein